MTVLQQLLVIPLLAPLLAVLLLGAINPRPPVALRVLVWTSPALPVGAWIAAAAAAGAGLSAAATTMALRQSGAADQSQGSFSFRRGHSAASGAEPAAAPRPRTPAAGWGAGPSRPPGEPAPTVEVAYRVIRRPAPDPATARTGRSDAPSAAVAQPVGDGWDQPLKDDWE